MPISQLAQRCWTLHPEPELDERGDRHYDSEAEARQDAKDAMLASEPRRAAAPCWTIACDGDCDTRLDEEDEGWLLHASSRAEAEKLAIGYGWIVTRDGQVFCDSDAPDCSAADLAVTEPTPGQLTLDGNEVGAPEPALEGTVLARCGHPDTGEGHCDADMTCPNYIGYCTVHPGGFPMVPEVDCRTAEFQARWRTRKEVTGA